MTLTFPKLFIFEHLCTLQRIFERQKPLFIALVHWHVFSTTPTPKPILCERRKDFDDR
jgi:hypothetical protein